MTRFKKALDQVRKGELVTDYNPQSREEECLLALVNGTEIDNLCNPLTRKEELLQLLATKIKRQTPTLLWENENPNAVFVSQEITLNDSIIDRDFYIDYKLYSAENGNHGLLRQYYSNASFNTFYLLFGVEAQEEPYQSKTRTFGFKEGNIVKFGSGYVNSIVNDNNCVPIAIYSFN